MQRLHDADRREHRRLRPAARRPRRRPACCSRPWATTPWCWARWPWPASSSAAAPSRSASPFSPKYPQLARRRLRRDHRRPQDLQPRHLHPRQRQGQETRQDAGQGSTTATSHTIGPKELEKVCRGGPGGALRRRRQGGPRRTDRRRPALPQPAGDPLRDPADGRSSSRPTTSRSSARRR